MSYLFIFFGGVCFGVVLMCLLQINNQAGKDPGSPEKQQKEAEITEIAEEK